MTSTVAAYVGIGANLGDAATSVKQAMTALSTLPQTELTAVSSLYASAPVDAGGDDYVNAVVLISTQLDADALLQALQKIEQDFGRERSVRNAPRTLDLDLLLYGQAQIASATLEVPHPRMTARAFVLLPLLELDPVINIPGKGAAASYLAGVADQIITPISDQAK
jgi:2-amino-4-hydroxy-6-hydroxymethyldihydropteridine diphosphokinase